MRTLASRRIARAAARADALVAEGRFLDAVDLLTEANRTAHDAELERRLVGLRHEAYWELPRAPAGSAWPVVAPGDDLVTAGLPVVAPEDLTPEAISTGIARHGCLHVRRLVPEARVQRLVDGIDRAMAGFDVHAAGESVERTTPWFEPFVPRRSSRWA